MQNISVTDIIMETKSYKKALDMKLISPEMYHDSIKLAKSLCQLCLSNQIETYNRLINELQKKPVPISVPAEPEPAFPAVEQPTAYQEDKEVSTNA